MQNTQTSPPCRVVLIGDMAIGKSHLLIRIRHGAFPKVATYGIPDWPITISHRFEEKDYSLRFEDKDLGYRDGARVLQRPDPLAVQPDQREVDVLMIAFCVQRPYTMEQIAEILRMFDPKCTILVGLRSDLRKRPWPVNRMERHNPLDGCLQSSLGFPYIECSAYDGTGIRELLNLVVAGWITGQEYSADEDDEDDANTSIAGTHEEDGTGSQNALSSCEDHHSDGGNGDELKERPR